jgi:hypothetical protein
MGRDLEPFAARLTDEVVIDANQVIFGFTEDDPIVFIRSRRDLRFLGAAQPFDGIVIRPPAAGALEASRALLGLLGEKLTFVHARSVPH